MAYPAQIDIIGTATDSELQPYGAPVVVNGTNIYKILAGSDSLGADRNINAYKSTDDGNNWTLPTTTNRPTPTGSGDWQPVYQDIEGTKIWVVYLPNGSPPTESRLQHYDMAVDTWGSPITGGPMPWGVSSAVVGTITYTIDPDISNNRSQLGLNVRSNGDKVVIYNAVSTAGLSLQQDLYYKIYNGTSWSSANALMLSGTTDQEVNSFGYVGSVTGTNDMVHVFAWTQFGYVYASITTNITTPVRNYRRFDNDALDFVGLKDGVAAGYPKIVHMCDKRFAALPHPILTTVLRDTGTAVTNWFRPALLMIPDVTTPEYTRYEYVEDQIEFDSYDWVPVAVACDTSAKSTYLVWGKLAAPTSSFATQIRMSCSKGVAWSDPQTLVTTTNPDLVETIEISVDGGKMRSLFENSAGAGVYTWANYYQFSVSCDDEGCGADSGGSQNYAFIG